MKNNFVREYRQRLGLTQVELSREARIAQSNLSAIERGRLQPWDKAKESLCRVLGVPLDELFPNGDGQ